MESLINLVWYIGIILSFILAVVGSLGFLLCIKDYKKEKNHSKLYINLGVAIISWSIFIFLI